MKEKKGVPFMRTFFVSYKAPVTIGEKSSQPRVVLHAVSPKKEKMILFCADKTHLEYLCVRRYTECANCEVRGIIK